jgi:acyl-CoA reductase-like NAD-dependent aldehyde dehydrogenase
MRDFSLIIDGAHVPGAMRMPVINPATGQCFAEAPRASAEQLEAAVDAAAQAFAGWSETPIDVRRTMIEAVADRIEARSEEFARLLTLEQGKPLREALYEVGATVHFLRSLATLDLPRRVIEDSDRRLVEAIRRPLGVVAAIIPWNFPLLIIAFKVPMALLAGNSVVIKPAPTTPLTALLFGEVCADLLPPGVVNVIVDANDLGAVLTAHPKIRKISFTGSTETGRKVMASAAPTLKRLTLELGGNDAAIALDGIDAHRLAAGVAASAFLNAGQVCVAVKRLYVPRRMVNDVCDALGDIVRSISVGDGLVEETGMGPIQNVAQYDRLRGLLDDSRRTGQIAAGGTLPAGPGYFVSPTIVRDVPMDARIVREEQFGPILPVLAYDDVDEAIAAANGLSYGLGASVWSNDPERAAKVARRVDAGTVWVNVHTDLDPTIPFCGAGQSGVGVAFAEEGLAEYTQLKVINTVRSAAA